MSKEGAAKASPTIYFKLVVSVFLVHLVPAVACFTSDSSDSVEPVSGQAPSVVGPVEKGEPGAGDARVGGEPVPAMLKARETLKRQYSDQAQALESLMASDPALELEILAPAPFPGSPQQQAFAGPTVVQTARAVRSSSWGSAPAGFRSNGSRSASKDSAGLSEHLAMMEFTYRQALLSLFGDRAARGEGIESLLNPNDSLRGRNPFQEALSSDSLTGQRGQSPSSQQNSVPAEAPGQGGVTRSGVSLWETLGRVHGLSKEPFSFVLFGDFTENGQRQLFRAFRDSQGDFVLENSAKLTPSGGFLAFRRNDLVLTGDLNGDGLADLVSATVGSSSTTLRIYLAKGGLWFQRIHSFTLPAVARGLALFEFTGDGSDDLVFLLEGNPHLVVCRRTENTFEYDRELALPFSPGLLVERPENEGISRGLHVFDTSLSGLVTFEPGSLGTYREGPTTVLELFQAVTLEGESSVDLRVLQWAERMTLVEKTTSGVRFHGSFAYLPKIPLMIFGDYFRTGGRQILLAP